MTSYKELYLDEKKKLKILESNCIDLRGFGKGKMLNFSKNIWRLYEDSERIIVERIMDMKK